MTETNYQTKFPLDILFVFQSKSEISKDFASKMAKFGYYFPNNTLCKLINKTGGHSKH